MESEGAGKVWGEGSLRNIWTERVRVFIGVEKWYEMSFWYAGSMAIGRS